MTQPPLKPEIFEILLAMSEGPIHGWGIVQEVEDNTAGRIQLAPSLLYRRLRSLEGDGLVEEVGEAPSLRGGPRKQYALTGLGKSVLQQEAQRLVEVAARKRIRRLASD